MGPACTEHVLAGTRNSSPIAPLNHSREGTLKKRALLFPQSSRRAYKRGAFPQHFHRKLAIPHQNQALSTLITYPPPPSSHHTQLEASPHTRTLKLPPRHPSNCQATNLADQSSPYLIYPNQNPNLEIPCCLAPVALRHRLNLSDRDL